MILMKEKPVSQERKVSMLLNFIETLKEMN